MMKNKTKNLNMKKNKSSNKIPATAKKLYSCKKCKSPTNILYNGKCESCEFKNDK